MREFMNYDDWLKSVPTEITGDLLWKVEAYRLALFLADLGWRDVTKLTQDRRMFGLSDQLYRAVGSISANISEGYSRSSGKDRARFYEYALGSARESRGWFYKSRHMLGENVAEHRMRLTTQIIRLLLTMVPDQRNVSLHEDSIPYVCSQESNTVSAIDEMSDLLNNAPLPEFTNHASRITPPDENHAP
jgi:four helix bundle protein